MLQAERDQGRALGLTTDEKRRLEELERENREPKPANEILCKASAVLAQAELDRGRVRRPRVGRLVQSAPLAGAAGLCLPGPVQEPYYQAKFTPAMEAGLTQTTRRNSRGDSLRELLGSGVMETQESRRFDPFPADGEWASCGWFSEVAPEHAGPEVISEAVAALLPIFPPDDVHGLAGEGSRPHPFAWHYYQRGGVRQILTLGRCLSIIGSPPEIVSDLAHPARYATRFAEAWTGALFVRMGARVRYVNEREGGKKPEFTATFSNGATLSVEVKALTDGQKRQRINQITIAVHQGICDAQMHASREEHPPSRAEVCPPPDRFLGFALNSSEPDLDAARALGRSVGAEWMRFLDDKPPVGSYQVGNYLLVDVRPEVESGSNSQTMMFVPPLPKLTEFLRLRRGPLAGAAQKFDAFGHAGMLLIDKSHDRVWDPEDIAKLERELLRPASWAMSVAAILLRYDSLRSQHRRDMVRLLPGPLAERLPPEVWSFFPKCDLCGTRHREVDFIRG